MRFWSSPEGLDHARNEEMSEGKWLAIRFLGLVLVILVATSTFGQARLRDYQRVRNEDWFKTYIFGIGNGYAWANSRLSSEHKPLLYCQDNTVTVQQSDFLQMLDDAVSKMDLAASSDARLESVLLNALQSKFPCPAESNDDSDLLPPGMKYRRRTDREQAIYVAQTKAAAKDAELRQRIDDLVSMGLPRQEAIAKVLAVNCPPER